MPRVPLFSLIVVCRNPGPKLRDAVASIRAQRATDYEIVVIDGASTDGTSAWLAAERRLFGTLISQPDRGIYDAMNKGIAAARGEWVLFLGADDRLADDEVLAEVGRDLRDKPVAVFAGTARFDDGRLYAAAPTTAVRRNFLHHQATFYRRNLFQAHGPFDPTLGIQADYDFNLRLLHAGVEIAPRARLIAECASGGLSDAGHWANYREEITVRHRHFTAGRCWPWDLVSVARWLRKQILRSPPSHG